MSLFFMLYCLFVSSQWNRTIFLEALLLPEIRKMIAYFVLSLFFRNKGRLQKKFCFMQIPRYYDCISESVNVIVISIKVCEYWKCTKYLNFASNLLTYKRNNAYIECFNSPEKKFNPALAASNLSDTKPALLWKFFIIPFTFLTFSNSVIYACMTCI